MIILEELCAEVDWRETIVRKYGGKYCGITEASGEFRVPDKCENRFEKETIDVAADKL